MKRDVLVFLCLIVPTADAISQDHHYWSQQFGATSSLMGGAMVAGVRDNTASFYNPGALSFIGNSNLSVDANVYRLDKIFISNGAGTGNNLNSAQVSIYPQIITGMINIFKSPRIKITYSILTRNFSNILMNTRYTRSAGNGRDNINYLGEFEYVNQLIEQWFGMSAGYSISEKVGVGISIFGVYRGQTLGITHNYKEILPSDTTSSLQSSNSNENIKYYTVGLLAKFGIAYKSGRWNIGASLTTPALRLFGSGNTRREESGSGLSLPSSLVQNPYYILSDNNHSVARFHYPLAISAGIEYDFPKTRITVSAEYYSAVDSYNILKPSGESFFYPGSLKDSAGFSRKLEEFLWFGNAEKPVINAGIGFSEALSPSFDILAGAHTDFSSWRASDTPDDLIPKSAVWDIYYFTAGVSYHQPRQSVTLGFSYSFSPRKVTDPLAIISPGAATQKAYASEQSFSIVLGYIHYFRR